MNGSQLTFAAHVDHGKLYDSVGILHYSMSDFGSHRLVLEVDSEIARYYRSFIPKHIRTNLPRYKPHVTVVRPEKETPVHLEAWGKYQDQEVPFQYSGILQSGKVYFWINVFCTRLEQIRQELGLPVSSQYTRPPEGYVKCFHATVANMKDQALS